MEKKVEEIKVENKMEGTEIPQATEVVQQEGIGKKIVKVLSYVLTAAAGVVVGALLGKGSKDEDDSSKEETPAE